MAQSLVSDSVLPLPDEIAGIETRSDGPADARALLILGHGAGQDMDSEFMATMTRAIALSDGGIRVVRFNFPFMSRARREGRRRPPDREPVLLDAFRRVIAAQPADLPLFIGGKSLGGRMASLIADETSAAGLVCLGYPFHPTGRPGQVRTRHLENLRTPALICQGERDAFGRKEEVSGYLLSKSIAICWIDDGDHSFTPRKSSGRTAQQCLAEAATRVIAFIRAIAQA